MSEKSVFDARKRYINDKSTGKAAVLCLAVCALLLIAVFPDFVLSAVQSGVERCVRSFFPALFPSLFLVCLISQAASGVWKRPKTAYVFAVLLSFVGGFVSGARLVCELCEQGVIGKKTASLSLCFMSNAGMAFAVSAVGIGLFGNELVGLFIFISLFLGSFCCFLAVLMTKSLLLSPVLDSSTQKGLDFFGALWFAARTTAAICLVSIVFECVSRAVGLLSESGYLSAALACLLEVSSGTAAAAGVPYGVYMAAGSMSVLSLSVLFQIKGILKSGGISLLPLILSRLLHLPVTLAALWHLLTVFESAVSAEIQRAPDATELFSCSPAFSVLFLLGCFAAVLQKKAN